jgi:hypothetical protein
MSSDWEDEHCGSCVHWVSHGFGGECWLTEEGRDSEYDACQEWESFDVCTRTVGGEDE